MKIRIKIQGTLVFLALAASILGYRFLFSNVKTQAQDTVLNILGAAALFLGFSLRVVARGYKAEMSKDGRTLIKKGPYAVLRNPMYLGTFFIGLGVILILFKVWLFFLFVVILSMIYIPQVLHEEAGLYKLFGEEYKVYCKNVPRFFPNLISLSGADIQGCLFFKLKWVKPELRSFAGLLVVITAVKIWKYLKFSELAGPGENILRFIFVILLFSVIFILFARKKDEK